MTRSPVALARKAVEVARRSLPDYSSRFSRKDFTQPQLFALLVLMAHFKTDLRGVVAMVADWSDVREAIGLRKVPHFSTLHKAQKRLLKKVLSQRSSTLSSRRRSRRAW